MKLIEFIQIHDYKATTIYALDDNNISIVNGSNPLVRYLVVT